MGTCRNPGLGGAIPGLATMEWTFVRNGVETVRRAGVPTSQVLVPVQIPDVIDGLWLEWKLVPVGTCRHPGLGGAIPGLATMEWTCVRNGVETVRRAGVPTSQVLVPVQIPDVIDGLWLEWKLVPVGTCRHPGLGGAIAPPRPGCWQVPTGTSFHSSHKPSISSAICTGTSTCEVGTPARLTLSIPFLTQVHSIVASPGIAPHRPGCRQLPTGTSFHSSHKPSITSAICTGTSTCEVGTPARLTVSTPFLTQVHSIVASPGIAPPRPGCRQVPTGTSFHSSHKPSITSGICTGTSTCEVGWCQYK